VSIRDILEDVAPELLTTDPTASARMDRFIGYAADEVSRDTWGDKADMATALLAAHKLTLATRRGANQGALTGERLGDASRTYATPAAAGSEDLAATSHGAEFARLRRTLGLGIQVL
jgi:hypothetical protein